MSDLQHAEDFGEVLLMYVSIRLSGKLTCTLRIDRVSLSSYFDGLYQPATWESFCHSWYENPNADNVHGNSQPLFGILFSKLQCTEDLFHIFLANLLSMWTTGSWREIRLAGEVLTLDFVSKSEVIWNMRIVGSCYAKIEYQCKSRCVTRRSWDWPGAWGLLGQHREEEPHGGRARAAFPSRPAAGRQGQVAPLRTLPFALVYMCGGLMCRRNMISASDFHMVYKKYAALKG